MSGFDSNAVADRQQIIANCRYLYPNSDPIIITSCEEISDDAEPLSPMQRARRTSKSTRWRRTIAVLDAHANNTMLFSSAVSYDSATPLGINNSTFVHILHHSEKRVAAKLKKQRESEQRIVRDVLMCVGNQETKEVKGRVATYFLSEAATKKAMVEDSKVETLVAEVKAKLESGIGESDAGEGSSSNGGAAPPPPYYPHEVQILDIK